MSTDVFSLRHPPEERYVEVLDQTLLPHERRIVAIDNLDATTHAIRTMQVRGAPLIGAVAAFGLALALDRDDSDGALERGYSELLATRPTAVNLRWALDRVRAALASLPSGARAVAAWREADLIAAEDGARNLALGEHGFDLLRRIAAKVADRPLQLMTHCNAGALATVEWGTATAPIYLAQERGLQVHVWVSETRPRLQGAQLTAWELSQCGVAHTVVADNACGHLMRSRQVDVVIVGADRVAANGDVCNKIGTYDKALAAADNQIPFYAAVPGPTIDWDLAEGSLIPIEERHADEVLHVAGRDDAGRRATVRVAPLTSNAWNPAFDVTPSRLITGLITERGVAQASARGLRALYPPLATATGEDQR